MATVKPFAALRPRPELAARICELPYEVMSSEEARVIRSVMLVGFLCQFRLVSHNCQPDRKKSN
jgi:uncharacterized protein (DUF1015 family)